MADNIEVQAKTDRELLIMAVDKLNDLDEKFDGICGNVDENNNDIGKLKTDSEVLKEKVDTQKKINGGVIAFVITLAGGIILDWFKH